MAKKASEKQLKQRAKFSKAVKQAKIEAKNGGDYKKTLSKLLKK